MIIVLEEFSKLPHWQQVLLRSLLVGSVVTASLSGIAAEPALAGFKFGAAAYAQAVTDAEVTNYARAVLEIEQVRQPAFNEIKQIISPRQMPEIVCNRPDSFNSLPANARGIAQNFCQRSNDIAKKHLGTPDRFNIITINQQQNARLRRQIQRELLRLQGAAQ